MKHRFDVASYGTNTIYWLKIMNIHSDAYPEPIDRLQNENKYLKEEIREEKKKLESTIRVLNKEIEELKKKNTTLNNKLTDVEVQNKSLLLQVEKFEKIIKGRFYTIWDMQLYV